MVKRTGSDERVGEAEGNVRGTDRRETGARGSGLVDLVKVITERADPIVKLLTTACQEALEARMARARFSTWMALVAAGIVTLIVGVAGWLTYADKVDGSTFGFLLGVIVGYVLTFVRDAINPPKERTP